MGTHYLCLVLFPVSFSSINLLLRIVFFHLEWGCKVFRHIYWEISYFCSIFMIFVWFMDYSYHRTAKSLRNKISGIFLQKRGSFILWKKLVISLEFLIGVTRCLILTSSWLKAAQEHIKVNFAWSDLCFISEMKKGSERQTLVFSWTPWKSKETHGNWGVASFLQKRWSNSGNSNQW